MGADSRDNWELIQQALAAESTGKTPRLFSSRRTLFGIPSALDEELAKAATVKPSPKTASAELANPSTRTGRELVTHPLPPVFDENSQVLLLGTMPSPKSRETGFYYGHPQNRFWKVLARLFDEPTPEGNEAKQAFILRHHLALWDVLAQCTIQGAKDGSIADCVPNDLGRITAKAPIRAVFCTGAKAAQLYERYGRERTGIPAVKLPSTSAANAAMDLDALTAAYRPILEFCKQPNVQAPTRRLPER